MNKNDTDQSIFPDVSSKAWKQRIQYELSGADYNTEMLYQTTAGIKTKPFYNPEDQIELYATDSRTKAPFKIGHELYCNHSQMTNKKAIWCFEKGCDQLKLLVQDNILDPDLLTKNISRNQGLSFTLQKAHKDQLHKFIDFLNAHENPHWKIQLDPIEHYYSSGHWWKSQAEDFQLLKTSIEKTTQNTVLIDNRGLEAAGANTTQQLAYAMAHAHEYILFLSAEGLLNKLSAFEFIFNVRATDFLIETAKLRAFEILWNHLMALYGLDIAFEITSKPSKIDQTLFQNNLNLIRNTSSLMAAIWGNSSTIYGLAFDHIHKKSNAYSDRLAMNQLLILKHECGLSHALDPIAGSYAIDKISAEIAENALSSFKQLEAQGGFLQGLKDHSIQKDIDASFQKQLGKYVSQEKTLIGANTLFEKEEMVFEKYPFLRIEKRKTLIPPVITKRYASHFEQKAFEADEN